jgi:hypothetical protein
MEIEDYKLDTEENVDILIDLITLKFNTRMNRFMKEYGVSPIFNDFKDTIYCNDMKAEMFCGEVLRGYVMERKFIMKRINYDNGKIDLSIENCTTIGQLTKKICKCSGLGKDIIAVDNEKRILDENLILQMHPEEVWICLNDGGTLIDVILSKIEYEIVLNGSVHNFMAVVWSFNKYLTVWNKFTLGYALKIWKESVNRFPDYDWILYNNKRLKDIDLMKTLYNTKIME